MVKLANMLSRLNPAKILVIGDMLLDTYTVGKARRISPEAPVAIVNVQHEEHRPGGAGNVILNLLSLGAHVVAMGRTGKNWAGQVFIDVLENEGVDTRMILPQEGYQTPLKNRIIADNQQIVRIDHEQIIPLSEKLEQQMIERLPSLLEGVKVVAISDYGKGLLSRPLLAALMDEASKAGIPVITDPKGHDFGKYAGTTLIKPNLGEAYAAAKLPPSASLDDVAAIVLQQCQAEILMMTRSEAGISLFHKGGERFDFPVHAKEVKDVTGAGDTVLAMLSHALANGLSYQEAAELCNMAAGIAIEHVGCARVTLSDLAYRLFQDDICHKVFDQEHVFVLKEILKSTPFTMLLLTDIDEVNSQLFKAIKTLAARSEALLIYVNDDEPREAFIDLLSSLREVNFIVIHLDSIRRICESFAPREAYCYHAAKDLLNPIEWTTALSTDKNAVSAAETA